MVEFNLSLTKLNERQNHDDFLVVWFCANNFSNELKNFDEYLRIFKTFNSCIDFIKSFESECKILLVIEGWEMVSHFNNYSQIQGIYILNKYCQNVQYEKETYSKLVDTFTNEHELIVALRRDILLTYRSDLPISISYIKEISIEQSLMSSHGDPMMFYWNQLFTHYLVNFTSLDMTVIKEDMIKQCQLEYKNNSAVLLQINDFDKMLTPDDALSWYTKDSFLYRLLTKAFRTRNIDLICKFQYFIILLYKKLQELSLKQEHQNNLILFRGQNIKTNELEELKVNVGYLISINTFMSTTRNKNVAQLFIDPEKTAVVFEINTGIHNNNTFKKFADISEFSTIPDEEEILFTVGTVFRIESIEKENGNIWIIKLTLNTDMDEQIKRLNDDFERQFINASQTHHLFMKTQDMDMIKRYYKMLTNKSFPLNGIPTCTIDINVGYIWSNLGNYEKAIQLYQNLLLNDDFIDTSKSIVFNLIIAYKYFNLLQYDDALLYYGIAYSLLDENSLLTGELYNHIADVWMKINRFEIALSYYQEALRILCDDLDNHQLADIYQKMRDVHHKLDQLDMSNMYEQKVNKISQLYGLTPTLDDQTLSKLQYELENRDDLTPDKRARHIYSIGLYYMTKQDYFQALQNLLQAEQLYITHRPLETRFFATYSTLYDNLALVYLFLKDNLKALSMWKKALDIRANIPSM